MLKINKIFIKTIYCPIFTYVYVHVYHECAHTWYVYM